MAKKELKDLTIKDIIQKELQTDIPFFALGRGQQNEVARYVKSHKLNIKVLGRKWYDVLTDTFHAVEFLADEDAVRVEMVERSFDSFGGFFDYVDGDIYAGSCFYGYDFTAEQIGKYNIKLNNLNFVSSIDYTIDDFSFEALIEKKEQSLAETHQTSEQIKDWIDRQKPIATCKQLETKLKQFTEKFGFWDAKYIFFSMMIRKFRESMKQAALDFACSHDSYCGLSFADILLNYGVEGGQFVIDNYEGIWNYSKRKRRVREYKDMLVGYQSGTHTLKRTCRFDGKTHLYCVRDVYSNGVNHPLKTENYFADYIEFLSFVNNDPTSADLSEAPISPDDIKGCVIGENTKLPKQKTYSNHQILKGFDGDAFYVIQRWVDDEGLAVLENKNVFKKFFNFVYFLKGDLSNADLLLCEGLENIKDADGLILSGVKVRSKVAEKFGLPLKSLPKGRLATKSFEQTDHYELATIDSLMVEHPKDEDYSGKVSYISDIHLLHRFDAFRCKTVEDTDYVIRNIAKTICEQATGVNLIGGDTSSNYEVFESFVRNLALFRSRGDFFFTLGNHELWGLNGETLPKIVEKYKSVLDGQGNGKMHLVQNNLFYADDSWKEITEEDISQISPDELRLRTRSAKIIIFGGIGFAGTNNEFNSDNGIYRDVLNRESEIAESVKFLVLYEKVTSALRGRNLIILTHMPLRDWGGADAHAKEGVVYVNGHSHRNYFFDDGKKRIYADNQVGYKGKRLSLKQVGIDFGYDWFADYEDGIYEITKEDYEKFYRGIGEGLSFNRQFEKLFLIKSEGTYMFLMQTTKGSMLILNGGSIKKAGNHSLEYFYDNIVKYAKSVRMFLSTYDSFQRQVSSEVKRFGGDGTIHGSIVDIDFYNHLYLNPLDGSITPYFAYSMVDKYVYENLASLLKYECPKLFANYERLIAQQAKGSELAVYNGNLPISKSRVYIDSTEMYKISRILKGLQFTTKYNIVRLWNDAVVADASEENGRLIVQGIIDPDSVPRPIEELKPKAAIARNPKPKADRPVLSEEEKIKIRDDKYKALISSETGGKVVVETYRGSTEKADYRCTVCGYEWSTRPDHFKDRQGYKCPRCKKGG